MKRDLLLTPKHIYLIGREKVINEITLFLMENKIAVWIAIICLFNEPLQTSVYLHTFLVFQIKKGPEKGKIVEVVKRKLTMNDISSITLR